MRITKRQLRQIIREECQKSIKQRRLVESNYPFTPYPSSEPAPDPNLVKLGKLILNGDLDIMRKGLMQAEDTNSIVIEDFEDSTAPYTRYKGLPPEQHRVFKVEFTTSPEFHSLLRKIYSDVPKSTRAETEKNWQDMISFDFGGLREDSKVKISFSNDYDFFKSKWTNIGQFRTY